MPDELVLRLAQPSAALLPAFQELAAEFVTEGDERYRAALDSPEAYLRRIKQYAAGINLPPGRVRETTFWAVSGEAVLAFSRLRHQLTPELTLIGGHIGYGVRPGARRGGVGTRLLALTLTEARRLGLDRVLITCDLGNIGSAQVIERNGGVREDVRVVPGYPEPIVRYWVATEG
jgi:predicted acetyltransferase